MALYFAIIWQRYKRIEDDMEAAFDSLKFYDQLIAADVPERQARVQAEALRSALASHDVGRLKDLATKGDIQNVRQEIQNVRQEIQDVRQEIRETELRILKWVIGTIITQTALIIAVIGIAVTLVMK